MRIKCKSAENRGENYAEGLYTSKVGARLNVEKKGH
jgi:hypothetical protein